MFGFFSDFLPVQSLPSWAKDLAKEQVEDVRTPPLMEGHRLQSDQESPPEWKPSSSFMEQFSVCVGVGWGGAWVLVKQAALALLDNCKDMMDDLQKKQFLS